MSNFYLIIYLFITFAIIIKESVIHYQKGQYKTNEIHSITVKIKTKIYEVIVQYTAHLQFW